MPTDGPAPSIACRLPAARDILRCRRMASRTWWPTVNTGSERGHRLLEDHADPPAAQVAQLGLISSPGLHVSGTMEFDGATYRLGTPEQRQAGQRLAAAALADHPRDASFTPIWNDMSSTGRTSRRRSRRATVAEPAGCDGARCVRWRTCRSRSGVNERLGMVGESGSGKSLSSLSLLG